MLTIDLVISLWNSKTNEQGIFTCGTASTPDVDMLITDPFFVYRNKFTANTQSLYMAFLNKANKHLRAIVYKRGYSFPELVINAKKLFITVNREIEELLKGNLVDLIVYGRKATTTTTSV